VSAAAGHCRLVRLPRCMQVAATMASSTLLEAAAAAQKAQHQLASLEFSMAAFAEAQQEVSLLQQVSELPIMP